MNPFDYFKSLRPQIENNSAFMANLRDYAFAGRMTLVENVLKLGGRSNNNAHFRIGNIGDLWFASREDLAAVDEDDSRLSCESYIQSAIDLQSQGLRVPTYCGVIKAEWESPRYFLLLEDLTQGGTADFRPALPGEMHGTLNGVEVYYDFEPSLSIPEMKYTLDDKVILLKR